MDRSKQLMQRLSKFLLSIPILVLLCTGFAAAVQPGTILTDDTPLLAAAEDGAELVCVLASGDSVSVMDESIESWLKISYTGADGREQEGYVARQFVRLGAGSPIDGAASEAAPLSASTVAKVTGSGVRIRNEGNLDASILTHTSLGDLTRVLNESAGGWAHVSYYDGNELLTGYISSDYLEPVPLAAGISSDSALILREEPERASPILTVLPAETAFDVVSHQAEWYEVRCGTQTGYVLRDVLALEEPGNALGCVSVTADSLTLLSAADTESEVLAELDAGTVLLVTENAGNGWYGVTFDGQEGYLVSDGVQWKETADSGYIQVTADVLHLRAGAGTDFTTLAEIPLGTLLTIEETCGDWCRVTYQGLTGYVSAMHVSSTTEDGFPFSVPAASAMAAGSGVISGGSGAAVAAFACQFEGNPYVWGGTSLTSGCDCSGFVLSVYAQFGVSLPHSSGSLRSCGTAVSYADVQPGDIICYDHHVGIYAGNGQIINALGSDYGICYTSATYKPIITVRRIFS